MQIILNKNYFNFNIKEKEAYLNMYAKWNSFKNKLMR